MSGIRHITRFESIDGVTVAELPEGRGEVESVQEFRTALEPAVGMGYAVDLHGRAPAPVGIGQERLRAVLYGGTQAEVDSQADALRRVIGGIGQGRLWSVGADGSERWAWARPLRMPDMTVSYESPFTAPVVIEFARLSDWYAPVQREIVQQLGASPATFVVTNGGTADARAIEFLLIAKGASGFSAPRVTNAITGESWASTRVASNASHQLRVDTGRYAVERSVDAGVTWESDYSAFSTGTVQVGFMRLIPGAQNLTITGAPNATLLVRFDEPFR